VPEEPEEPTSPVGPVAPVTPPTGGEEEVAGEETGPENPPIEGEVKGEETFKCEGLCCSWKDWLIFIILLAILCGGYWLVFRPEKVLPPENKQENK